MADNSYRIVGPPGSGKTQTIRAHVEGFVERGEYAPEDFLLTSFTRAAAIELRGRVDVPERNAATLHSVCYQALGRPAIAETGDLKKDWNAQHRFDDWKVDDPDIDDGGRGERTQSMHAVYALMRAQQVDLTNIRNDKYRSFIAAWEDYKRQTNSIDFTDMLTMGLAEFDSAPNDPRVIIVDEAQDLSPLQWTLLRQWGEHVDRFLAVGDPAQAIFGFAGARPDELLWPLPPNRQAVLGGKASYRLPRAIHAFAERFLTGHTGTIMAGRSWVPRDADGAVDRINATWRNPDLIAREAERLSAAGETVMILATCSYMLAPVVKVLREQGSLFHNPYRRSAGAWNPLGAAQRDEATSTFDRLQAFLRPAWTWGSLGVWLPMLSAKGDNSCFLGIGAKKALEMIAANPEMGRRYVSPDDLAVLTDEAQVMLAKRDAQWLSSHCVKRFADPLKYANAVIRRHGPAALQKDPLITVGSVHSVKGGEAGHVILFPDLSSAAVKAADERLEHRDANIRTMYVGITRARERLILTDAAWSPWAMEL